MLNWGGFGSPKQFWPSRTGFLHGFRSLRIRCNRSADPKGASNGANGAAKRRVTRAALSWPLKLTGYADIITKRGNISVALSKTTLSIYGLLGLPLALVGYPIAVWLPAFYAGEIGVSLAAVATMLLVAKLSSRSCSAV